MSTPPPTTPSQTPAQTKVKKKGLGEFWRAAKFVHPYRRLMVVSILAAFLVGATGTAGLTLLMPIMKVLLNDDTVARYIDRTVVEKRLGVVLDERRTDRVRVDRVADKGRAMAAGISQGDLLQVTGRAPGDDSLSALAAAASTTLTLAVTPDKAPDTFTPREVAPREVVVTLDPARWYTPAMRGAAHLLPTHPIKTLAWMLGLILVMAVVANFFRFFQEHCSDLVAIRSTHDIRRKAYDHLLHVPLGYFGRFGTSDATSRLVSDAAQLQEGFKLLLGQSIQAPIQAGMALSLAMYIDWRLTVFIILFAPINVAIIQKFGKRIRRANRTALERNSTLLGQLEASLGGIQVVKAASAERFERRRYVRIVNQIFTQQKVMSRAEALTTPTMETLTLMVVSLVVLVAAYFVLVDKSLDREAFFLIMACLVSMGESLRRISKLNNLLQRANAAAGRIFEIIDLPTESPRERLASAPREHLPNLPTLATAVTFDNVSFAYPGSTQLALDGVSVTIPKGRVVAVVGRNGSGKTTLLRLLPRLYEPTAGRVLIDGVDIAKVSLASLRSQIALVTQESVIFPGTIHDNIAYGLPRASRADVEDAAQKAFAHDFILAKPQAYDTPLDGIGGQLSGGQRQRLSIARAILRKSPILILDEATSQVDAESEHLIQQAVETLLKNAHEDHKTTTFIIAHRFSTIMSADEILVMDKGRLVGRGTHRELLTTCQTYQQLYERQALGAGE